MVYFNVLGPVEVVGAAGEVISVNASKQRVLLALLICQANQVVSAERLIDLLWGGEPPASARANLQAYVHRLRRALGAGRLRSRPPGYLLAVSPGEIDVDRAVAHAEAGRYAEALALWRGEPYADCADSAEPLRQEADRLGELRHRLLQQRIGADLDAGRHADVIGELAALCREHPLREGYGAAFMAALHRGGRTGEALEFFHEVRRKFVDELGVEPGAALREAFETILRDDAPVPGVFRALAPAELPLAPAGFVGRDDELATLEHQLTAAGPSPVVLITGTAGAGKTALAVHAGHRVAGHFPDGQLYLNLQGYADREPVPAQAALARMLGSLGVAAARVPEDEEAAAALLRTHLADRRVLILLDNAFSIDQVRPLLPGAAGCAVLVTSRDRLGALVAGFGADRLFLGAVSPGAAYRMIVGLIGAERVAGQEREVRLAARLCAHLPLALRVAAANLADHPMWTVADYVAALRSDRFAALELDGDAAVRNAFNLSYRRLSEPAQRLFRLLGHAPAVDFGVSAVAALAGLDEPEAARLLEVLGAAHLIEESAPKRYVLHDLIRAHAREQADASVAGAIERLCRWYLACAAAAALAAFPHGMRVPPVPEWAAKSSLGFAERDAAFAWFAAEQANLVATVRHCARNGLGDVAWMINDTLRPVFRRSVHATGWRETARAALAAAESAGDALGRASAHLSLGDYGVFRDDFGVAIDNYRAAIETGERAGWTGAQVHARSQLGIAYFESLRFDEAIEVWTEAIADYDRLGEAAGAYHARSNLGKALVLLGRLDQGMRHMTEALAGRPPGAGGTINANLAHVHRLRGEPEQARSHLERAVELGYEDGNEASVVSSLIELAAVLGDLGAAEAAWETVARARELIGDRGRHADLAEAHAVMGALCSGAEAIAHYRRALDLAIAGELRVSEVEIRVGLGAALTANGETGAATAMLSEALGLARRFGFRLSEADALAEMTKTLVAQGLPGSAREYSEQALAIFSATGYRLSERRFTAWLELAGIGQVVT